MGSDEMFQRLEQVISLLTHAEKLYAAVGDGARQILNTAVFEPFVVDKPADSDTNRAAITDAPLSPIVGAVLIPTGTTKRTPGEHAHRGFNPESFGGGGGI